MGPAGRRICAENGLNWLDLSGNASIEAPGLHVKVEGRANQFKRRGRPSSPFAPKSARIARWLLMHPHDAFTQRDLARAVDMTGGFTSRVVRRLRQLGLVEREGSGAVRATDPRLLLEAWGEQYDFERHYILRGHAPARSAQELLGRATELLTAESIQHAATGLSGAWLLTRFAGHRTVTCYVAQLPDDKSLSALGFRQEEQGANLWLVVPKDEGVFHGMSDSRGLPCVHPIQVWLDLKSHPERAAVAARELATTLLSWVNDE